MTRSQDILVIVLVALLAATGAIIAWCVINYRASMQVTVTSMTVHTQPASQPTSQPTLISGPVSVPVSFPSQDQQAEVLLNLRGKTPAEARQMLAPATCTMAIVATGASRHELKELVDEAAKRAQQGQQPTEYRLWYDVAAPDEGALVLTVKDGRVASAKFTPSNPKEPDR